MGPDAWDEGQLPILEVLCSNTATNAKWIYACSFVSPSCDQPGPDSFGIVAVSHGCRGVAARACGLVNLEPTKVTVYVKLRLELNVSSRTPVVCFQENHAETVDVCN